MQPLGRKRIGVSACGRVGVCKASSIVETSGHYSRVEKQFYFPADTPKKMLAIAATRASADLERRCHDSSSQPRFLWFNFGEDNAYGRRLKDCYFSYPSRWHWGSALSHTVDGRHNLIGREVMDHVARSRNSDELAPG